METVPVAEGTLVEKAFARVGSADDCRAWFFPVRPFHRLLVRRLLAAADRHR
jgi:hypothetical protein